MAKPQGICPQCELHVEWQQISGVGGLFWQCCNCWNTIDGADLKRVQTIAAELADLEQRRSDLIRGKSHATTAKNR